MFGAGKDGMINTPNPVSQFTLKMVELAVRDHDIYGIIRDLKLIIGMVKVSVEITLVVYKFDFLTL